jgi:hypothetical protein
MRETIGVVQAQALLDVLQATGVIAQMKIGNPFAVVGLQYEFVVSRPMGQAEEAVRPLERDAHVVRDPPPAPMRRKMRLGFGHPLRDFKRSPICGLYFSRSCTARRDQRRSKLDEEPQLLVARRQRIRDRLEELEATPQVSDRLRGLTGGSPACQRAASS